MKFYIDEDVDHRIVRSALRGLGHDAWSVTQAGRAGESDASQLAYAVEHRVPIITHDVNFARPHRDFPIGRVILLRCPEADADDTLKQALPDLIELLERKENVYITLKRDSAGNVRVQTTYGTERD